MTELATLVLVRADDSLNQGKDIRNREKLRDIK